jgi:hypothetical protein
MPPSDWAAGSYDESSGGATTQILWPGPLADLAADLDDGDALVACRLAIRKALAADPVRAAEALQIL